jgi:hypothetical protein
LAHHSDVPLAQRLTTELHERLNHKVTALIAHPIERTAGYIECLHDVLRIVNGEEVAYDYHPPHPGA